MRKKSVFLGLVFAFAFALALSSCTSKENEIVMVTNAEFPPFEFITDNGLVGRYDGIDIAIAVEIAKAAGKELVIKDMEFTAALLEIGVGNADFMIAGLTAKEERKESMDFSIPYYTATQVIIVPASNDTVKGADDLHGIKVGVITGYTGAEICMDDLGLPNLEFFNRSANAISALTTGAIDAFVIDSVTAGVFVKQNPNLKIVEDDDSFGTELYAVAVTKGDTETLNLINGVLEKMLADGSIAALAEKYIALAGN
jgi:polar amino acid transport system substrate-binding protein